MLAHQIVRVAHVELGRQCLGEEVRAVQLPRDEEQLNSSVRNGFSNVLRPAAEVARDSIRVRAIVLEKVDRHLRVGENNGGAGLRKTHLAPGVLH